MIIFKKAGEEDAVEIMRAPSYSGSLSTVQPTSLRDREQADVRKYLENTTVCRRKWLLEFFYPSTAKRGSSSIERLNFINFNFFCSIHCLVLSLSQSLREFR